MEVVRINPKKGSGAHANVDPVDQNVERQARRRAVHLSPSVGSLDKLCHYTRAPSHFRPLALSPWWCVCQFEGYIKERRSELSENPNDWALFQLEVGTFILASQSKRLLEQTTKCTHRTSGASVLLSKRTKLKRRNTWGIQAVPLKQDTSSVHKRSHLGMGVKMVTKFYQRNEM